MKKHKWFIIGFIICLIALIGIPIAVVKAINCPPAMVFQNIKSNYSIKNLLSGFSRLVFAPQAWAGPCGGGGGGGGDTPQPPNQPPVANALARYWSYTNETVRLKGTGSDPDGFITLYEWDFDGNGTYDWSSNINPDVVTHRYPNVSTYLARFRVTDNQGATATDTALVDIHTPCPAGSGSNCYNVTWNGRKWQHTVSNGIKYVIDLNTIPAGVSEAEAVNAIINSQDTWDSRSSNFEYVPDPAFLVDGTSGRCRGCGVLANDNKNVIYWGNIAALDISKLPPNAEIFKIIDPITQQSIGRTICYDSGEFNDAPNYDPAFQLNPYLRLNDCDIILNSAFSWSTSNPPPANHYDIQTVVTHELGHWLNLGDLDQAVDQQLMMYGEYAGLKRNLGTGDVYGIQYLYGS